MVYTKYFSVVRVYLGTSLLRGFDTWFAKRSWPARCQGIRSMPPTFRKPALVLYGGRGRFLIWKAFWLCTADWTYIICLYKTNILLQLEGHDMLLFYGSCHHWRDTNFIGWKYEFFIQQFKVGNFSIPRLYNLYNVIKNKLLNQFTPLTNYVFVALYTLILLCFVFDHKGRLIINWGGKI